MRYCVQYWLHPRFMSRNVSRRRLFDTRPSGTNLISCKRTTQQNGVKTAEDNSSDIETSQPKGGRKPSKLGMQKRKNTETRLIHL